MRIPNSFDSHVHWLSTGEHEDRLRLEQMKTATDVRDLEPKPIHFRGDWLIGFGWDQNNWSEKRFPTRHILDQVFPGFPVAFSRADGHAIWVNSKALEILGLISRDRQSLGVPDPKGGLILKDDAGIPTGVLIDVAMEDARKKIPEPSRESVFHALQIGMQVFNRAGYTHIRDLTCTETQWNEAIRLEQRNQLTLAVEQYFDSVQPADFDSALSLAVRARNEKSSLLRATGIKLYYDGALGSEGALLSLPYHGHSHGATGLELMTEKQLAEMARRTWEKKFDLAVHVIGDEAAQRVMLTMCRLWDEGHVGRLHLEHAEMLRPETIRLMKNRNLVCHIQPCHWLTDRAWTTEKLGPLAKHLFRWKDLEEQGIAFDFGSDSPIEPPSLNNNFLALKDSAEKGIPPPSKSIDALHQYPDPNWTPDTYSVFKDYQPFEVWFLGKNILTV